MIRLPEPTLSYDPREQSILRRELELTIARLNERINEVERSPRVQDIQMEFDGANNLLLTILCNPDTLSFRFATSTTAAPDLAAVAEEDIRTGSRGDFEVVGPFAAGTTVYVSVVPYSGVVADGMDGPLYSESEVNGTTEDGECRAIVFSATATQLTVEVFAPTSVGVGTVAMTSLTGTTQVSGNGVGVYGTASQTYVFNRPGVGQPNGEVRFNARFPNLPDAADILTIPAQGLQLLFLASRAQILETSSMDLTVRVSVLDPVPQGANTLQIAYALTGLSGVTPASPQLVTPVAYFSGLAGTYVDFTVPRPLGADGEILFTVTSTAGVRILDKVAVTVPFRPAVPASLSVRPLMDDTEYTIEWAGTATVELSIDGGAWDTPPASPITVERQAVVGGRNVSYTFRATGELGDVRTETVIVLRQNATAAGLPAIASVGITPVTAPCDGGGSATVTWTVTDMPGTETFDVEWSNLGPGAYEGTGGSDTGVTTPYSLNTALCSGDTLRVRVKAYAAGVFLAERTVESVV